MQIQSVNNYGYSNTNFKHSVPVFVRLDGNPAITETLNNTLITKFEHLLNNSLERGKNPARDGLVDRIRDYYGQRVKDFNGKVSSYRCLDGGIENGALKPFCYFTTGIEKSKVKERGLGYKDAKNAAQGYVTAELEMAKDKYKEIGEYLRKAFMNFNPYNNGPRALVVDFKVKRNKNGLPLKKDAYEFAGANFVPVDGKNPTLQLEKQK